MKTVILAGGLGTRISEESYLRPKPMIEIGGYPILWHIMKIFYSQGVDEFIICAGYKQHMIKEYFADYFLHRSDITFDFTDEYHMTVHANSSEKWKVTVVDTGLNTLTGGRIKRVAKYLGNEPFLLTYGDGVSDVDIKKLIKFHKSHGKLATLTAVHPVGRFGVLDLSGDQITSFGEKTESQTDWINGGFMVLDPKVIDLIDGDETTFEKEPMEALSAKGELMAYKHNGFWQCMDTLRDKQKLEALWESKKAPWKSWE
ncbi:glucose-1-phosphate cytidylyltransferase [Thermoplasmatales archaeon BRNA1]|nr:glucose-1-phosphate cytidylyltransferase [Thermoplasmatales archaeon BRNA1]